MSIQKTDSSQCVLASGNKGKLAELSHALAGHNIELISQSEFNVSEAIEDAPTFIENALIKARHASQVTGLSALADDSGLVVPVLNGEPGIFSARYAMQPNTTRKPTDADNINKLLEQLQSHSDDKARAAYFVCALVYLRHADDPEPLISTGLWHGRILHTPEGENGFGYDPVFYCPKNKMASASMSKELKSSISHRAIALEALNKQLTDRSQ